MSQRVGSGSESKDCINVHYHPIDQTHLEPKSPLTKNDTMLYTYQRSRLHSADTSSKKGAMYCHEITKLSRHLEEAFAPAFQSFSNNMNNIEPEISPRKSPRYVCTSDAVLVPGLVVPAMLKSGVECL